MDAPGAGWVDWNQSNVRPVYQASLAYARLARWLAERSGRCDSEQAWAAGLLAPLGWLAMCAVDPSGVAECLADPGLAFDVALPAYEPDACPLCAQGLPVVKPGSRPVAV